MPLLEQLVLVPERNGKTPNSSADSRPLVSAPHDGFYSDQFVQNMWEMKAQPLYDNLLTNGGGAASRVLVFVSIFFFFFCTSLLVKMLMSSTGCLEKYITAFNLHPSWENKSSKWDKEAFRCYSNSAILVLWKQYIQAPEGKCKQPKRA